MEPLRVLFQLRTVQRSRVFRSLYPPVRRREMSLSSHVHCIKHALLSSTGTIGDSSQGNACENNVELRIVSRPSCDLKCDVGYEPSSSVLTCSSDAVNGVTAAQTNLICNEYTCSAITYPVETMSGNCEDPLTSVSSTSCELSCIPGYSGTYYLFLSHPLTSEYSLSYHLHTNSLTLIEYTTRMLRSNTGTPLVFNCDSTGNLDRAASVDSNYCTENRCASYFLSSNESPYGTCVVLFCSIYIHFT